MSGNRLQSRLETILNEEPPGHATVRVRRMTERMRDWLRLRSHEIRPGQNWGLSTGELLYLYTQGRLRTDHKAVRPLTELITKRGNIWKVMEGDGT